MPRGGSKKGEHRGNAKARPDGTPKEVMRNAVAARPRKPGKRGPAPGAQQAATIENEVVIAQTLHGIRSADDMAPKQIALENMHCFQNRAFEYEAMSRFMAGQPDCDETRRTIRGYEMEEERNRRLASDEAHRLMPFMHPRLAAIAHLGEVGAGEDIVQRMFDEIDRRNREHPMVIEHTPMKKTG